MSGKVFISCGQRPLREKCIADKVGELLKQKFNLDYYLAYKIQGLNDIMKITEELRSSDYYLFIDFYRKDKEDLPCSLFTHQELALAHHLGFKEIIAFQEKGAPLEGFLRYIQANPEPFENEDELLKKIEEAVGNRSWTRSYSRNLIVADVFYQGSLLQYADHTGDHFEHIWHAKIENRRPDVAAVDAVCILDYIRFPNGQKIDCDDRSYLKWAGQIGYQRTILPEDHGVIDIFAVRADEPGVYLHSARDVTPRTPIIKGEKGNYKFCYKVFSEGFPLLSFVVDVKYQYTSPTQAGWGNVTKAVTKAELTS